MRRSRMRRSDGVALSILLLLLISLLFPILTIAEPGSRGDGNDSFDTAQEVESHKQTPVSYIGVVDDPDDFYWIEAPRGQVVEAHFIILQNDTPSYGYNFSNPAEVNFDLEIFGPRDHTSPLTSSASTNQFEIESVVAAVTGKYHFKVHAVNNSGDYVFMVRILDPTVMEDGGVYTGYVKESSDNDADWYKVDLDGGNPAQAVKVTMTHDGTANMDLFLMDLWSKNRPYWLDLSWFGNNKEEVYGVASYSGFYYLKVHAFWGHGDYQIKVEITDAPTDDNDHKGKARFLEYNSTWTDHVDQSKDKYDYFEVRLDPQEEVLIDLRLLDNHEHIYSVFLLEVDLEVVVEETNYIFQPQHDTSPDIEFSEVVDGGVYYIVVMAKVALKNPDDLSDENAAADYKLVINMSKHPERPPNRSPVVRAGMAGMSIVMEEDTTEYLNLDDVFEDPDGDKLIYSVSRVDGGDDLSMSVDMSGTVTIVPKVNWFGTAKLNFTAEDPSGAKAFLMVNLTVTDRPEPPIVVDYGPSRTSNVAEGADLSLFVVVVDEDSFVIWYNWSVDGVDLGNRLSNLTYSPDFSDAGFHNIVVEISDGDVVVEWDWDITVNDINRVPKVTSVQPSNDSRFKEGEKVNLAAVLEDPDGDILSFEWREGLDLIGKGSGIQPNINHTFPPGKHTVKLTVTDNKGATTSRVVTFKVEKKEEGGFDLAWLALGAMVALVVAFLIYSYAPRGSDDEEIERALEEEERGRKKKGKKGRKRKKSGRKARKRGKKKKKKAQVEKEESEDGLDEELEKEMAAERKRMRKKRPI